MPWAKFGLIFNDLEQKFFSLVPLIVRATKRFLRLFTTSSRDVRTKFSSSWPTRPRQPNRWPFSHTWCPYVRPSSVRTLLTQNKQFATTLHGAWWVTKFARLLLVLPLHFQFVSYLFWHFLSFRHVYNKRGKSSCFKELLTCSKHPGPWRPRSPNSATTKVWLLAQKCLLMF